jgi:signal transduction histidine kinase
VLLAKTLRSSTFKRALVSITIFAALIVGLLGYVYWSTTSYILDRVDRAIETDRAILLAQYERGGPDGLVAAIDKFVADKRIANGVYLLTNPSFVKLAGNLNAWPQRLSGSSGVLCFSANGKTATSRSVRAAFQTLPDGSHLLVGMDVGELDQIARGIYLALVFVISLILVIAIFVAVSITRRTVSRIESINATSRAIMQRGLGERVLVRGSRDEWDLLAENLNAMLDRIELLMGEVKQATDNVAHDLRTPLTRIRGRLEKAFYGQRDSSSDQTLITDTLADLDEVLRMFSSLTRISQIEAMSRGAGFQPVDLAEIAKAVVELYDAAAESKHIKLRIVADGPATISGDRDFLFDALANVVDNAIKHGREAGEVTVELSQRQGGRGVKVAVSDNGPGIPAEERQNIFKRFYRLERSRGSPGNGLGLSLVAAVAHFHGARVELFDNMPGLRVELQFTTS